MSFVEEEKKRYIEKGKKILPKNKWDLWEKTVSRRMNSVWDGLELTHFLQIQEVLIKKEKGSFEDVRVLMDSQGHSGASFNTVCKLISSFCEDGTELVNYLKMD